MTYKAGVVGAAGYAGIEVARILSSHPSFVLECATSDSNAGTSLASLYPSFTGVTDLAFSKNDSIYDKDLDVAFLAVPHTAALAIASKLISAGTTVVDLSADFRLKDAAEYERWYGVEHTEKQLLADSAFGLPELFPEGLKEAAEARTQGRAQLIACAGCYPTATSLAAAPITRKGWAKEGFPVVADAISGVTGAGKKANARTHFCSADENLEAYSVASHRHTPEIEQILDIPGQLIFTPHLAPLKRGILSTATIRLSDDAPKSTRELLEAYDQAYAGSSFVSVLPEGELPKTSSVAGTNRAHISVVFDARTDCAIAMGAIDNLCKGAAGQAVQCANIVFGLQETEGLDFMALPV